MKHFKLYLILACSLLIVGYPIVSTFLPSIQYSLTAPQALEAGRKEGSLILRTSYRNGGQVNVEVNFWGADVQQRDFSLNEDQLEIPFTVNSEASAVIYQVKLKSVRGDYAFFGRINLSDAKKVEGLQLLTDRVRYRPGDTVRVLGMNYSQSKGLLTDRHFELSFVDGKGNVVDKKEVKVKDGLLISEFQLSDKVNKGSWKAFLSEGEQKVEVAFDVVNYVRRRMDINIDLPTGFISLIDQTKINVTARHLADGNMDGVKAELKVKYGEEVLWTQEGELSGGSVSFSVEPKVIQAFKRVVVEVSIEDGGIPETSQEVVPIRNASAEFIAVPQNSFMLLGHKNSCFVKFSTSEVFKKELLESLRVNYEKRQCDWKKVEGDIVKVDLPSAGGELSINWLENGVKKSESVDTSTWPTRGYRFNLTSVDGSTVSGLAEWEDEQYKIVELVLIMSGGPESKRVVLPVKDKGSLNFQVDYERTVGADAFIEYQLRSLGETRLYGSCSLKLTGSSRLNFGFSADKTAPGSKEELKFDFKEGQPGVAALIVTDVSLNENSHVSSFEKLKKRLSPELNLSPTELFEDLQFSQTTYADNESQRASVTEIKVRRLNTSFKSLFICFLISTFLAFIYAINIKGVTAVCAVIGIVLLLGAMILPALGNAREKAKMYSESVGMDSFKADKKPADKNGVRRDFKGNLLFSKVHFDKNGKVQVPITVADNLTTWRAEVLGFPADGGVVYGKDDIISTKDLFIEFSLPVYFIKGDRTSIYINVFDKRQKGGRLEISVPAGVELGKRQFDLEPGKKRHFLRIPVYFKDAGSFTFSAKVQSDDLHDHIEQSVEVKSEGIKKSFYEKFSLQKGSTLKISTELSKNALKEEKFLIVYPGSLSANLKGLEKLLREPTGCFEQTSSKNFPNIVVYEYLKSRDIMAELQKQSLGKLRRGYQRLVSYEVDGGGFSLYGNAPASPWLTAYGLLQFSLMKKHIYIDPSVLERSWKYLKPKLAKLETRQKSFALMCAMEAGLLRRSELNIHKEELITVANSDDLWSAIISCRLLHYLGMEKKILSVLGAHVIQKAINGKGVFQSVNSYNSHSAKSATMALGVLMAWELRLSNLEDARTKLIHLKRGAGWSGTMSTALALRSLTLTESNSNRTFSISDKSGKSKGYTLLKSDTKPQRIPLLNNKSYSLNLTEGRFLGCSIETQAEFRYGRVEPLKPAFEVLIENSSIVKAGDFQRLSIKVRGSEERANDPMLELPLPAGFSIDEGQMKALVSEGELRHFELKPGNRLICYLPNIKPKTLKAFIIKVKSGRQGQYKSQPGRYYEYYRPEASGYVKLTEIEVK
jgi:hypothetical protein